MSRQLFTRIIVPAAVMAALMIAEPAGAQPPPPGPPPMRGPGPPPTRAPVLTGPRPVGPPPTARPAMRPAPPSARPPAEIARPGAGRFAGGAAPGPLSHRPGGWTPPGDNRTFDRAGTYPIGRGRADLENPFIKGTDVARGEFRRNPNDLGQGTSAVTDAVNRRDITQGFSSAADTAKGWYDRAYARDLLYRWPWYAGGWGYSSGGDSGASDNGYGTFSSGYTNPYTTQTESGSDSNTFAASAGHDSSPTTVDSNDEPASSRDDVSAAVKQRMDRALLAFQSGDYAAAQRQCEQAIELAPADGNLYEGRALCQFAQGDYRAAAATLYEVLAAGPGWNWSTLISLYSSAPIYTKQLRTLEQFVRGNPSDAAGHFVLAYHYLVVDARDAALGQLREVTRLQPQDKLSASIVQALEKAKQNAAGASAEKPTPER